MLIRLAADNIDGSPGTNQKAGDSGSADVKADAGDSKATGAAGAAAVSADCAKAGDASSSASTSSAASTTSDSSAPKPAPSIAPPSTGSAPLGDESLEKSSDELAAMSEDERAAYEAHVACQEHTGRPEFAAIRDVDHCICADTGILTLIMCAHVPGLQIEDRFAE